MKYLFSIFFLLSIISFKAQKEDTNSTQVKYTGILLDEKTKEPLPFAHVLTLKNNKGVVTNNNGVFTLSKEQLKGEDSLKFYYIGYKPKTISIKDFYKTTTILLTSESFSLNEFFVFGDNKNAEDIVKAVLLNKDKNYKKEYTKKQFFMRQRYVSDQEKLTIKFKKSSFDKLNKKMVEFIEKKIPKQTVSYSDFLANIYTTTNKKDTAKIDPIKLVSLKDKSLADVDDFEEILKRIFYNVKEKEYWKIKSGIIGSKLEIEDEKKEDSLSTYNKKNVPTKYYAASMGKFFYGLLENKKKWEFLHYTNRYDFELVYGTLINGEKVYVIEFTPKSSGKYEGKVYVSMDTYALVKADYSYAAGKTGRDINLFGVGYTENVFDLSVYFERTDDAYELKYYSKRKGERITFDRNISLIKKKKRFLLDKKIHELKVRLDAITTEESLVEILVVNRKKSNKQEYTTFKQPIIFKRVHVNQFSDDLWKNYTIIEPSKQMRDYKKMK